MLNKQLNVNYKYLLFKNIKEILVDFSYKYKECLSINKYNIFQLIKDCHLLSSLCLYEIDSSVKKISFGKYLKEILIMNHKKNKVCIDMNLNHCVLLNKLSLKSFSIIKNVFNNIHFNNRTYLRLGIKKEIDLQIYGDSLIFLNLIFLNCLERVNIEINELNFYGVNKFKWFFEDKKISNKIEFFGLRLMMCDFYNLYNRILEQLYFKISKIKYLSFQMLRKFSVNQILIYNYLKLLN